MVSPISSKTTMYITLIISISLLIHPSFGSNIICEELPPNICAFSVSASSKRCVLESYQNNGKTEYQCRTSNVGVDTVSNHIESDQCVNACGVDRKTVGISSDALLEPSFVQKLCSAKCFQMCPNVIDLYYNLAAAEGVHLPDLCHAGKSNPTRAMAELMSSGSAPGPSTSDDFHINRRTSILSPNGAPAPDSEYANQVSDSSSYYNAPANAPGYFDPDSSPVNAPAPSSEYSGEDFGLSPDMAPASAPGYSDEIYGSPESSPASAPGYSDEIYGSPESSPASAPGYSDGEYSNSPGSAPASAPGYSDGEYSNSPGSAPASAPGYSNGEYSDSPDSAPASAPGYSGNEYSDSPGSASAPDSGIFDSLCRDCL